MKQSAQCLRHVTLVAATPVAALSVAALSVAVTLVGCGTKKEASAPSFREQQAAQSTAGAAPAGKSERTGESGGGAPALVGDPGYKTP